MNVKLVRLPVYSGCWRLGERERERERERRGGGGGLKSVSCRQLGISSRTVNPLTAATFSQKSGLFAHLGTKQVSLHTGRVHTADKLSSLVGSVSMVS